MEKHIGFVNSRSILHTVGIVDNKAGKQRIILAKTLKELSHAEDNNGQADNATESEQIYERPKHTYSPKLVR